MTIPLSKSPAWLWALSSEEPTVLLIVYMWCLDPIPLQPRRTFTSSHSLSSCSDIPWSRSSVLQLGCLNTDHHPSIYSDVPQMAHWRRVDWMIYIFLCHWSRGSMWNLTLLGPNQLPVVHDWPLLYGALDPGVVLDLMKIPWPASRFSFIHLCGDFCVCLILVEIYVLKSRCVCVLGVLV